MQSHDHHFKNLFLDFPKQALEWLLPNALQQYGAIEKISFVRQEPKKRRLQDRGLVLDMPILFSFEKGRILLWIVEFQEDKKGFSIYRLLRYTTDLMEQFPDAVVIPTVMFTARKKWKTDIRRSIESRFSDRLFLHFEYQLVRILDYRAADYYHTSNPLLRILLPKMDFPQHERKKIIRLAYKGLFDLVDRKLFEKYVDFIDIYAEVSEEEKEDLYQELCEREETVMLAQYIRSKGFEEGVQVGIEKGVQVGIEQGVLQGVLKGKMEGKAEGRLEGMASILKRLLQQRFGALPPWVEERIDQGSLEQLEAWTERMLSAASIQELLSD